MLVDYNTIGYSQGYRLLKGQLIKSEKKVPLLVTIFQFWATTCNPWPDLAGPRLVGFCLTSIGLYKNNNRIPSSESWSVLNFQNTIFGSKIPIEFGY